MPHHQFSIITQKFPEGPFKFQEISRISKRVFKFQEISRSCRHPEIRHEMAGIVNKKVKNKEEVMTDKTGNKH